MNYKEYKTISEYDKGNLCKSCGKPSHHASGYCWEHYDRVSPDLRLIKQQTREQLESIGLMREEGESIQSWAQRCKDYIKKSPVGAILRFREERLKGTE